jgi:S-adenosylmethionine:tRNA-ribosyltransferase-isomerase (queuine synthetase)
VVSDLPGLLRAGDVLVFNDTRVIPAQLEGRRFSAGGGEAKIGATLHKRIDLRRWQAFVKNGKRLREGDEIAFPAGVTATAEARWEDGSWTLAFHGEEPVEVLLERAGQMPLPPISPANVPPMPTTGAIIRRCSPKRTALWPRPPPRCTSRLILSTASKKLVSLVNS